MGDPWSIEAWAKWPGYLALIAGMGAAVTLALPGEARGTALGTNANSGLDGGNDEGRGITDTPGGLKLQCEGHDVRYRNIWIKELDLATPDTDF